MTNERKARLLQFALKVAYHAVDKPGALAAFDPDLATVSVADARDVLYDWRRDVDGSEEEDFDLDRFGGDGIVLSLELS